MYTVTHLGKDATRPPHPEPVPRPGQAAPDTPAPGSAYDLGHIPAIDPAELGGWLST